MALSGATKAEHGCIRIKLLYVSIRRWWRAVRLLVNSCRGARYFGGRSGTVEAAASSMPGAGLKTAPGAQDEQVCRLSPRISLEAIAIVSACISVARITGGGGVRHFCRICRPARQRDDRGLWLSSAGTADCRLLGVFRSAHRLRSRYADLQLLLSAAGGPFYHCRSAELGGDVHVPDDVCYRKPAVGRSQAARSRRTGTAAGSGTALYLQPGHFADRQFRAVSEPIGAQARRHFRARGGGAVRSPRRRVLPSRPG